MGEQLVKKLFNHTATINDLVEARAHLGPKYQGIRVTEGLIGNPFFISEIGRYKNNSVGIIVEGRALASYSGKIGNKMDFEMKYLNNLHLKPKSILRVEGLMDNRSGQIDGTIKLDNTLWHTFRIYNSVSRELFYTMLNKQLKHI